MNLKRRGLSLLMCICMIVTLLPVAAFADDAAVVYGKYDESGKWQQDPNMNDTVTYDVLGGNSLTLSKTATPLGDNTYRIDLTVVSTQTTTTTPPDAAATVLVIDVSGSMKYCAECGGGGKHEKKCKYGSGKTVSEEQQRLAAAKNAAISFLDSYRGDTAGTGRYVSVVAFSDEISVNTEWVDVSNDSGYNKIKNVVKKLEASGGTNLDAGLRSAKDQLSKDTVKDVDAKNVIALTDGRPTFYVKNGESLKCHGNIGCPDTNKATAESAAGVRTLAKIYTVCFGASNELCWEKDSKHSDKEKHDIDGPKVGDFLRDSIATNEDGKTYAYNAGNTDELMNAFRAITSSITTGINAGTVTDPMTSNISVNDGKPENFVKRDGNTYTWELTGAEVVTSGNKTTYTYKLSYFVTLDTTVEGFDEKAYHPTNEKTTLTSGENTYDFPIPGVKGVIPSYNVSYAYTGEVPAGAPAVPASASHKQNSTVDVAAALTLDGYTFSGWSTNDATVSDGSFKMPGKDVTLTGSWSPRSDLSYTVNYYWNGTTDKVADSKVVSGQTFGDTITSETPIAVDGYTDVPYQTSNLTIGTGANVINFYYYKNAELTANSDTVTYDSKEHSVSGFTGAPVGADFSGITVGAKGTEAGEYPAEFARGTIGTVDASEKYIVTAANNGKLVINPIDKVTVTITGNTATKTYNGSEQTVTGYDVSISNPLYKESDFTFSGNAAAKGTDAGTYNMGLKAEQFVNNSKNFTNVEFVVNDGSLTIAKRNVTLTSATDSKVYDSTPLTNDTVTVTGDGFVSGEGAAYYVTGTITDVGSVDNAFTYTLNEGTKAVNYNINTVVGTLRVTPLTGVVVTITEHSKTVPFNGTTQTVTGYDFASSSELYKESDFTFKGNATAAGLIIGYYPMELKPADFENTNANFKDVEFEIVDGGLTITPLDTIIVTITGNTATKTYNGSEQKVEGYTVSINSDLYTADDFEFDGTASAARTDVGKTMMGLKAEQFKNTNDNFNKVAFNIVDGWIEITPNETELKVVANSNSWVYDGKDHADGGYTVIFGEEKYEVKAGESATLSTGDSVTAVIEKTVKHVSDTAEGNNVIVRLAVDNEGSYKTVTKVNGTLSITAAPLTITAGSSSQPYVDGVVMCNEYTNTPLVDGDNIDSVKITGKQDGPGKSDNVPSDAVIKNEAGEVVTGDYDITYVNGVLEGVPKLEKDVHFNYIMGYKDGTIRPNNNITRAEVATIFFRLLTDESRDYYWKETNDFKDIPDNYWACPAISTLTNAGILKGFEDGNFRPNEPVTRAQMATIIARFANLSEGTVSFTDIEGHWAQRAIELAAGNGWINGYEDGTFRPNDKITRAATMAMINRVLDRHVENVEDLLPDMNVWSDNMDTSYNFYFDIQEATNFHECQRIDNSPNEKWTVKLDDIDWTVYEF